MARQVNTDGEGPLFKNDNAQELYKRYVDPSGTVYSIISSADDAWSEGLNKRSKAIIGVPEDYANGGTLRLILPFLKAKGVTNAMMEDMSKETLNVLRDARESIELLLEKTQDVFIISTSYERYVRVACKAIGFPFDQAYCTEVDIDTARYRMLPDHKQTVLRYNEVIRELTRIPNFLEKVDYPRVSDYPSDQRRGLHTLNRIFWKELYWMKGADCLIGETVPVGGTEKVRAIEDSLVRAGNEMHEVMYVGDSITDRKALETVRKHNGLAVSFNGGYEPMEHAEIGILSYSASAWALFGLVFVQRGKVAAIRLAQNWREEYARSYAKEMGLESRIVDFIFNGELPEPTQVVYVDRASIRDEFAKLGKDYRKRVRADAGTIR